MAQVILDYQTFPKFALALGPDPVGFGAIASSVPGANVCERLPEAASPAAASSAAPTGSPSTP
jgi:hypothetical protein